ncbi:hypothetical protein CRE_11334 [Caenorhabditis remanei]|uniref:Uncharacterized protein n=1 Tax=Caenorhabditis remanei TaxID=31234 RepID=E3N0E3_CAERE|nr:hypothetical protein CRE_11334 [Caenorhabditis remanei]
MNQHTFHVDSQGGTVNFTINNVCNIIVAPTTFVSSSFRRPQEDPSTYNNHQNEGATRSREHEQNDNGDAPNRTTNATTLPEGHSYELPPPRENRSPPNVIILPYLVDNEQQDVIPVEHRLLLSNNPLSVATQGEISDAEGRNAEDLRGPDGSTQTVQISEVQTPVDETADAGGAQFGVVQSTDARIAEMSMNDAILTDVEMDDTPLAETLITDDETAAAQTEEVQTADGETAHAPIIDAVAAETAETQTSAADIVLIDVTESAAAAGIANTQTAAAETSDTQLIDFQIDDIQLTDVDMVNTENDKDLEAVAVGLERDRRIGGINAVQTLQNNDVAVAEGSGSTLLVTRSVPVTPSIPRQNRKRRAETDDGLCPPTPRRKTTASRFLLIQYHPSLLRSSINVTVSNVMTEKMPVGQNRYIQHFRIKDTATPFFAHHITLQLPLRFIMYTTKYPTNESYNRVLGNSQCNTRVKSYLANESFINEIEMNLNEKGKKDFHDIIRTTIDHFARDAATAVRLANRFLQSTRVMNQYTFFVNVHGEHVNYTINNITNIIVTPNTFAPPSFRPPQEDTPTYNTHQNEGTSRSSGNEPNDYGDAPSTTANANTVPEGHPDVENEVPPPRANLSNQQDIIGMPAPIITEGNRSPPTTNEIIPLNSHSGVGTLAEVSGIEGKDAEDLRGPDESTQTAGTTEVQISVAETVAAAAATELAETQTADTVSTDAERSVAETSVAETAVAAETAEIQTSAAETTDILLIDAAETAAAAGIANTQTAAAETFDTQLIDFQIDDIQSTDVEMVNTENDEDLNVVAVGLERDRHFGAINAVQTLQNNDVVVAEGSGSTLLATRSVPVTPSIPRQNRKRRAETDDGLCPPTPRRKTTASRFLLIQYHPSLLRSSMSP